MSNDALTWEDIPVWAQEKLLARNVQPKKVVDGMLSGGIEPTKVRVTLSGGIVIEVNK